LDESIYAVLASRVRLRRAELGMSQQQTAVLSGLTRSSIASIETGRQSVLVHHLYALARALDLSPQELLPPAAKEAAREAIDTPRRVELFVASLMAAGPASRRKGT